MQSNVLPLPGDFRFLNDLEFGPDQTSELEELSKRYQALAEQENKLKDLGWVPSPSVEKKRQQLLIDLESFTNGYTGPIPECWHFHTPDIFEKREADFWAREAERLAFIWQLHDSNKEKKGERDTPLADALGELRDFAGNQLKGIERAVIEALCNSNGELPIADLAVKPGVDWSNPVNGFKNAQRRLNPKLKKQGWTLQRKANTAKLKALKRG